MVGKSVYVSWAWWHMPVVPATWQMKKGELWFKVHQGKNYTETLYEN
jgi:hypothetical protein